MRYLSFSKWVLRVLIVVSFGVIGVVFVEADSPRQDDPPAQQPHCATCHVDIVSAWQTGTHAQAYSDPIFQEAWQEQGENTECLACHTTGYVAFSGEYHAEGVTCEACHGVTPGNHPPEPMQIDTGAEVCATCHTTTYQEWQVSAHGEQQLACTTCHNPHPQELRFGEVNALCLNCHDEAARDDYVHVKHQSQECANCHWHHASTEDRLAHYISGDLFPTGHEGIVQTVACVSCHETMDPQVTAEGEEIQGELGLTSEHPLHEAQVRIKELEAEVDTLAAQGANISALRLAQGFVIGSVLGGIILFVAGRFRRRSVNLPEPPVEEQNNG